MTEEGTHGEAACAGLRKLAAFWSAGSLEMSGSGLAVPLQHCHLEE